MATLLNRLEKFLKLHMPSPTPRQLNQIIPNTTWDSFIFNSPGESQLNKVEKVKLPYGRSAQPWLLVKITWGILEN